MLFLKFRCCSINHFKGPKPDSIEADVALLGFKSYELRLPEIVLEGDSKNHKLLKDASF